MAIMLWTLLGAGAAEAAGTAVEVPPAATVKQTRGGEIIPERFLRRWDPVTLFFKGRVGPEKPAPEDRPERYVTMVPSHPGVFTWLNPTTLQFRPAEPWPPLARYTWRFNGESRHLSTLMESPATTLPADGERDLQPVESITLSFPEPVDTERLAQLVKIELRSLPGVGGGASRWLDREDFKIKVMERERRDDPAVYVLLLNEPIPGGTRAVVNLRLSLEDDPEQAFKRITFATAAPFRVTRFGCANNRYPTAPEGIRYTPEQAIQCSDANPQVEVEFSAPLAETDLITARNLVRFTPAVEQLDFAVHDDLLVVHGDFKPDTLYRVSLQESPLRDRHGRDLESGGLSELYLHFPPRHPFLAWESGQGILERFGPQMVPLKGRGFRRLDLRIYPIDPLDRSFWPFPSQPVVVDESQRPPGPGERPAPFAEAERGIAPHELSRQIAALGSPAISELVELPLTRNGAAAKFGLDLKPYLGRIQGGERPGSYLVGMRRLDDSTQRSWIRVQVTDLSLSVVEERHSVRFVVTSLKSGRPVANARIVLEGSQAGKWVTLGSGESGRDGAFTWRVPKGSGNWLKRKHLRRILVSKDDDRLVLDPAVPPDQYQDNLWSKSRRSWLDWIGRADDGREPAAQTLCHIFTERPVYKPEEPVHIKGYVRQRLKNRLTIHPYSGSLLILGPGEREWRYPLSLTESGSFYHKFEEEKLPTGSYSVYFDIESEGRCGGMTFRKEAYRIPRFEVSLSAPDKVSMDQAFRVRLSSRYYAGGQVSGQPVRWRVTQFPYTWTPQEREGFYFSTDGRFSGREAFRASPVIRREGVTDAGGAAEIEINPAIEATAQPRSYVVEATVVGADDQTVSNTRRVLALPPLVLGLKAPRYLKSADSVTPEIIALGPDGALLAGREIRLKLSRRQWHSHLQATDFSSGSAKYVTEVVDEPVSETTLVSAEQPVKATLKLQGAGVYIVEIESHDRLGRAQVVSVDFYAGGDEPVTWSRPPSKVFKVTPDAGRYAPGETARLVLESPFQNARALAILEGPEGNRYDWLDLRNGSATYELPVTKEYTPRVPVHFLLMRGRVETDVSPGGLDLGKPATLAATAWVEVEPVENRVEVVLEHPEKAQPGDELEVALRLSDKAGRPLPGEVTLWLVDQAVLALGEEQRLEPLPDFITAMPSQLLLRDTRNLALGYLPFEEQPGGGATLDEAEARLLEDNVSLRKNFKSVPYFNPAIAVGRDGVARVKVKLPDNLTVFKLRAKAVSGAERFGFAKSQVAVRLPVIVQPSLPRFVRPGDRFVATAIGRIVEGEGGEGLAEARVSGMQLEEESIRHFEWQAERPQRLDFKLRVPTPGYDEQGRPDYGEVSFTGAVERVGDRARDAFEVKLPIRADHRPVVERVIAEVTPDEGLSLPAVTEAVRPGTLKRSLLLSNQPGLIRMAGGLNYLLEYPHGCTEQRLSRARAYLAMDSFRGLLYDERSEGELKQSVNGTLEWIEGVVDNNGLAGYWPGSRGYVSLTAWVVQFMVEAREAGYSIDETLLERMRTALRQALRSDYRHFIDGEAYGERSMALWALAESGEIDDAYAAELARKADYLDLEGLARVLRALRKRGGGESAMQKKLAGRLWNGLVFRSHQGREIYAGLQENAVSGNRLILPSETRTLAEILRTLETDSGAKPRVQTLVDGLVTLGAGDGWGSTNATAAALLALGDFMSPSGASGAEERVEVMLDGKRQDLTLGGGKRLLKLRGSRGDGVEVKRVGGADRPLAVRAETRYLPAADGSLVEPRAKGFVVNRELLLVSPAGEPARRIPLTRGGQRTELRVGDVIEDHVALVNAEDRTFVAVVVPLAAGMEPLNPHLATAPAEAKPANTLTLAPAYAAYLDDRVAFYYDSLPKGNYHFYFRTRATIRGEFIQPAAYAEMMYEEAVMGNSAGARVVVEEKQEGGGE